MKIASVPEERWIAKAAGWNPELSMKYKTDRAAGRPRKRWEGEINDFLSSHRTENGQKKLKETTMDGSRQQKIKRSG